MRWIVSGTLALFGLSGMGSTAFAADPSLSATVAAPAVYSRMFEARIGVYGHDPISPERGRADFNGEFLIDLFARNRGASWTPIVPRLHVGGTVAGGHRTSQAYAGVTWTLDFTPHVFVEAGFGGAYHNGKTGLLPVPGFNAMGCGWGFHEQGSLGYRFSESWSVMATVEHTSNSGICTQNRGLTNVGMRIGYSF